MEDELLIDYASKATRFGNYIIDAILFSILFVVVNIWLQSFGLVEEKGNSLLRLLNQAILFVMYYIIFEYAFSQTPGKFITGTKVIDENGNKPDFKTLVVRNICRLIPFEAISFLVSDTGWHDSISKTYVINKGNIN